MSKVVVECSSCGSYELVEDTGVISCPKCGSKKIKTLKINAPQNVQKKHNFIRIFIFVTAIGLVLTVLGIFSIYYTLTVPKQFCDYNGCRPAYPDEYLADLVYPIFSFILGALMLSLSVVMLVKKTQRKI